MARQLDDTVLVSGQIHPDEVAALVGEGITMLVNNRPDGEEPGQPLGVEIEEAARAVGLDYRAIPIIRGIGPADAEAMQEAIKSAGGKLLAFCRTGTRSSLAWALANREQFPLDLNRADAAMIARVPGIGVLSANRLVDLRRERRIRYLDLVRLRCAMDKAKPFIVTQDYRPRQASLESATLRRQLSETPAQMALW